RKPTGGSNPLPSDTFHHRAGSTSKGNLFNHGWGKMNTDGRKERLRLGLVRNGSGELKVRKTRIGTNFHEHKETREQSFYHGWGRMARMGIDEEQEFPPGGRETGFQAYKRDKLGKTGRF